MSGLGQGMVDLAGFGGGEAVSDRVRFTKQDAWPSLSGVLCRIDAESGRCEAPRTNPPQATSIPALGQATGELTVTIPTGRSHTTRPEPILNSTVGNSSESTKDDRCGDTDASSF
ncbi:hypothetical protein Atai01_81690 [Amycolatopsis taiwanensis]|uniref:Uncharacterized protein n=1 Tax=Amycolatopsis taiwanensis TaxID=342230 RepID=A0A9W6RB79_9PSEU|nr:hypothetical protein Atai01_81690 [Amycolatopsis taiwanensis]